MCLAVPGIITGIEAGEGFERRGKVNFSGIVKEVNLACVPEANLGDYVIVHAGMAISKLDEGEAHEVFRYLEEMGEVEELKADPQDPGGGESPENRKGSS